jgi:molybdate transport system ATP-binding protein
MTLSVSLRKRLTDGFSLEADFSVAPGITMLFGASGSGKTTLLRCLAGLVVPDTGRVTLGDRVLFDAGRVDVPARRRNVGYVFQHLALFPHMTVRANLEYGLAHLNTVVARTRTHAIAGSFRIAHLLDRKPRSISGGERQRVSLARALVTDPSLLLLDEPLSALDYVTQSKIIEDLRIWNASRDIPILYVTHSHREVFALGKRILAMQQGRIVADGTPQEVLEAPVHDALARLAGFENLFDATVLTTHPEAGTMQCRLDAGPTLLEVPLSSSTSPSGLRVAIRAGDVLIATVEPRGLSARNILPGTVVGLRREGATIIADIDAGVRFVVHLTPSALGALQLASGQRIWLIIKTYSCRLVNRLEGS